MTKNLSAELYSLLVRSINNPDLLSLDSEKYNVQYLSSQGMVMKIGDGEGWVVTGQTVNELANGAIRRIDGWGTL